jgi:ribosomal protein L40E
MEYFECNYLEYEELKDDFIHPVCNASSPGEMEKCKKCPTVHF